MPEPGAELPPADDDVLATNTHAAEDDVLTSDMLIEEVSIDGMCGVY